LGNYTLNKDFYVVDLEDTHVVLGVQWLYSLGDIFMNYKDTRMEVEDKNGKQDVLRGMSTSDPRIVSNKCIEDLFIHGYVACVEE
jgi:hypothetical protein